MSTQTGSHQLSLKISAQQQSFRLLELPPQLADLVSVSKPSRLYFKSCPPGTSSPQCLTSTASNPAAEHLHLCTESQAYQVRQVSTSNSVYVIEPLVPRYATTTTTTTDGQQPLEVDGMLAPPSNAMTVIAKVDSMLELVPVSHDLTPMLERVLPIYDLPDLSSAEESSRCFLSRSTTASKTGLLSDIPAPDCEAEKAWRDLLAFEFEGRCARPSSATCLTVWQAIMDHVSLGKLDLSRDVNLNLNGFSRDDDQVFPIYVPMAEAILAGLSHAIVPHSIAHPVQLDRSKTVRWTGLTLLQARSETPISRPVFQVDDFLTEWRDLLPEGWRHDATLDKLPEHSYAVVSVDGRDAITWNNTGSPDSLSTRRAALETASNTAGKRKWHEKFKAQRKEIKK